MGENKGMMLIQTDLYEAFRWLIDKTNYALIYESLPTETLSIALNKAYNESKKQCWNCAHYQSNLRGYYRTLWKLCAFDIPYTTCPEYTPLPEEVKDDKTNM